ncbi:protein of unknown function DUF1329 [Parvibaculum lavamentivorans DS-1]|uniref:Outer membrane lipoprotein-sorting protein n=1 Tax=Parvibaculum lavamentivorans (strain DS-1 / DSM 13023 / NCIMB 13966) TaxID=402881 RepID=A7HPF3_PARL1|nr:DUF1329 domain-containing protein [Parvibaculum lavamentivorans]ABS61786.1 protein of unknown function DUF1329 [Parvibaculum lavamentivorans DS-1]
MFTKVSATAAFVACSIVLGAGQAQADSAADLGAKLTPIGAEVAGNAAGTIPAWSGGIVNPPAGYVQGQDYVDPYANDKKLFSITKDNLEQYRDNLAAGQIALLDRYAGYRMDVYPTHRSCAFPANVYEKTKANVGMAKIEKVAHDLTDAVPGGFPFPLPQSGDEVMWNHRTAYEGVARSVVGTTAVVNAGGQFVPLKWDELRLSNYYNPARTNFAELQNVQLKYLSTYIAPARVAGEAYLVHETLNGERNAWFYSPGLRRVRRAPTLSYDNPVSGYEGLGTADQLYMYNGRLDRYDWQLVGKKELYIPYNNYEFANSKHSVADLVEPNFPNRDVTRYELHRVWVIEATLKQGTRHLLPRRTFYIDEDSWRVVAADMYDSRGGLWRYQEETTVNAYDVPTCFGFGQALYDFQAGRYILDLVFNDDARPNFHAAASVTDSMFEVGALRKTGTR